MEFFDSIPGYREAIEKETTERESAFLAVPELLCGLPVAPLTLRNVATISQLSLRTPTGAELLPPEELELLLWILSPDYSPQKSIARAWKRFRHSLRFFRARMRYGRGRICLALATFFADAFADSPASSGGNRVQYTSWIASHVDSLASEYSWRIEEIMALPVKVAFQLEREISKRYNPNAILFNRSDKLRLNWLKQRNGHRNTN